MCSTSFGNLLGDIEVCEMLETVLTTCCQMRLSGKYYPTCRKLGLLTTLAETLRRSSESTMHALVRTVFSRLHALDPVTEEAKLHVNEEETQDGEIKLSVSSLVAPTADTGEEPGEQESAETTEVAVEKTDDQKAEEPTDDSSQDSAPPIPKPECASTSPYFPNIFFAH